MTSSIVSLSCWRRIRVQPKRSPDGPASPRPSGQRLCHRQPESAMTPCPFFSTSASELFERCVCLCDKVQFDAISRTRHLIRNTRVTRSTNTLTMLGSRCIRGAPVFPSLRGRYCLHVGSAVHRQRASSIAPLTMP